MLPANLIQYYLRRFSISATLTALIHGESKVGKSWLGASVPGPRLILDSEGRARYAPSALPKVYWDPRKGEPPMPDGTWDTCVASVLDYETMNLAFRWLRSGQHGFKSCVVDSLMEVQKRCIDQEVGTRQLAPQDWGGLLRELESLVRKYRDIVLVEGNTLDVVVFIVGTANVDGVQRPLLQGQLKNTVPYYIDTIGYLYKQPVTAPDGTTAFTRSLLVESQPGFVAGDGTGRLRGPIIQNPNFSELYKLLDETPITEEA